MSPKNPPPPPALHWNRLACDALYLTNTPPTIATRVMAILHTAMYDAMTVFWPGKEWATTKELRQSKGALDPKWCTPESRQKAYSFAAYAVLTTDDIFANPLPDAFKTDVRAYFKSLGYRTEQCREDANTPEGVGTWSARLILDSREDDCANQANRFADYTGYKPVNPPPPEIPKCLDRWQPLLGPNKKPQTFLTPHWGKVRPFGITPDEQLRPKTPIKEGEKGFKEQADFLAEISACLTDEQKIIAEFWAGMHEDQYAGFPGKDNYDHWVTPPAQLCRMVGEILEDRQLRAIPVVVVFFVLSNALLDASIAAWECKRHYDYVRPQTLVAQLKDNETFPSWGGPGRGTVNMEGEGWQAYIPTPPFAEYVSGHSTFSATMAEIVKCFFPDGHYGREVTIPQGGSKIEGECVPPLPASDVTLCWDTVDQAAEQAGMSRIYGGIHFMDGNTNGSKLGKEVATCVWNKACEYLNGQV